MLSFDHGDNELIRKITGPLVLKQQNVICHYDLQFELAMVQNHHRKDAQYE